MNTKKMTLPVSTKISPIEFNGFNTMSFDATTTSSLDDIYNQSNTNQQSDEQEQQQRLTAATLPNTMNRLPQSRLYNAHFSTASATIYSSQELAVENVMPGIYLSKNFIAWNEEILRSHGFTHIIIIDKHIQELYYPSPIFKLSTQTSSNDIDAFEAFANTCHSAGSPSLTFSKEFEAIDLNFGEKSYLTTVLPNCYRAVKFINKALLSGGTILVIDCNGGEQKCLTVIVAYLMYKHNIDFRKAFARLKDFYEKADLDRFYMSQLYEYEPILQVQRAQSRGHSCSRELHSAILKRKKIDDDITCVTESEDCIDEAENRRSYLLDTFNPLSHFNATQQCEETDGFSGTNAQKTKQSPSYFKPFNAWDDYAME